jgi:hypothetical protein
MNTTGAGIIDHVTVVTKFPVFTIPSHKRVMKSSTGVMMVNDLTCSRSFWQAMPGVKD